MSAPSDLAAAATTVETTAVAAPSPPAPPTPAEIRSLLASFEAEYLAAISSGDAATLRALVWNAETLTGPLPSARLYAYTKLFLAGRGIDGASLVKDIPRMRSFTATMFVPTAGVRTVPAVPAAAMKDKCGVDAYTITWPGSDASSVLLYFHGGGMFSGNALYSYGVLERWSAQFGMPVITVDYPLCPEVSARAAVQESVKAYRYVTEDMGINPKRVFLAGESGGGQMVLLLAQAIVRQGLRNPAAVWCISPVTVGYTPQSVAWRKCNEPRDVTFADVTVFSLVSEHVRRKAFPDEVSEEDPFTFPLHGSMIGIAPVYMWWSATELLAAESAAAAEKIRSAGGAVAVSISQHGMHAMPAICDCPESTMATAEAAAWMRTFFAH